MRVGAVLALALAAAFVAWLVIRHFSDDSSSAVSGDISSTSAADLRRVAAEVGHPVYWIGVLPDRNMELTRTSDGRIYVRYLPTDVQIGVPKPYLTISTYPYPRAYKAIRTLAKRNHVRTLRRLDGGIAMVSSSQPTSVYVARPGEDVEVEVFSPSVSGARNVALSPQLRPVK